MKPKSRPDGHTYTKSLALLKAAPSSAPNPAGAEDLSLINRYALRELTADEVSVRKFLLAHNAIDRDRERFHEDLLDDFAATLPGKSLLVAHVHGGPGPGLFFDANTEEMTPAQFKSLTGEEAKLPDGVKMVKVLWGRWFVLNISGNEEMLQNVDAGIYRYCSIGFRAADLNAVKGDFDQILYWEYATPGEATEGSLVWLGAQPGATVQKHLNDEENTKEEKLMDKFLKKLGEIFGKTLTEDTYIDEAKALVKEHADLTAKVADLAKQVSDLTPLAADGKAYRESLVTSYVVNKAKIGDIDEKPESSERLKTLCSGWPLDFLKQEITALDRRVAEKFPDNAQTRGDDRRDKTGDGTAGGKGENPIIPKENEK